jgi:hypothetical protein
MNIRCILTLVALALPMSAQADALFGNDMAGDRKLPRTWGIGIDYFSMDQPYQIDSLTFTPVLPIGDPTLLPVNNDIEHVDLKIDVWVLPFLNLFGIYGQIDGETAVDLSGTGLPLPPNARTLIVDYDGDVYGGGAVLAFGGDKWFGSVTATFTDTSLGGDINSTVKASTIQPRVGLRFGDHTEVWIGGYYIDAEESHNGTIIVDLGPLIPPGVPFPLDFDVDLSQAEDFNFSVGTHMMLSDSWETTIEVGGGDRRTVLANLTYRFD